MHNLFNGNLDVAQSMQDKAIELIGQQSPVNYEHAMMRVQIHGNMSLIYEQRKEPEKALEQLELAAQIAELSESMTTQKPGGVSLENQAVRPTIQYLDLRAGIAHERARLLKIKQDDRAAIRILADLLQKQTHTLLHYPPDSAAIASYQATASSVLPIQIGIGDHESAMELLENWRSLAQTLLDRSSPKEPLLLFLTIAHHSAGHVLEQLGQRETALERYRKALVVCDQTDSLTLTSAPICYQRVELEMHGFDLLLADNHWNEAQVHFEQAFEAAQKLWSISPSDDRFNHLAREQLRRGIAAMKAAKKETEAARWESELARHP
jgi:tetratricopeptide (TPR) repeat protein